MKMYVLHNDEIGYTDWCPVFTSKEEAEREAADKCRFHTVIEVTDMEAYKECHPVRVLPGCERCPRFPEKRGCYSTIKHT